MRVANPRPSHCACCYTAPTTYNPQRTYIDLEASYDGAVVPGIAGPISVDDMILCEDCVKAAARLIGWEDGADLRGENSEKRKEIEELQKEIRAKDKTIIHLNDTVGAVIDFPPKKTGGMSRIIGPDTKKDELAQVRKSRHRSERGKKASSGADSK